MSVTISSGAEEAAKRAAAEFAAIPQIMRAEVKLGAVEELQKKTYVDRTRNARKSTKGTVLRSSAREVTVELAAAAEYASYLRKRGFSEIDQVAKETGAAIQDQFDAMGERITKA